VRGASIPQLSLTPASQEVRSSHRKNNKKIGVFFNSIRDLLPLVIILLLLALIPSCEGASQTTSPSSSSNNVPLLSTAATIAAAVIGRQVLPRRARENEHGTKTSRAEKDDEEREKSEAEKKKKRPHNSDEGASVVDASDQILDPDDFLVSEDEGLRIITQNIRGNLKGRAPEIQKYIRDKRVDMAILCESKTLADKTDAEDKLNAIFDEAGRIEHNGFNEVDVVNDELNHAQGGIVVLFSQRCTKYIRKVDRLDDHRTLRIDMAFPERKLRLYATYAPPGDNKATGEKRSVFWTELNREVQSKSHADYETLVMGDVNAYEQERDAQSIAARRHKPLKQYVQFIKDVDVLDAYRLKNPEGADWTYKRTRKGRYGPQIEYVSRIDTALVSTSLADAVLKCQVKKVSDIVPGGDHKPLLLSLSASALGIEDSYHARPPPQIVERIDLNNIDAKTIDAYQKLVTESLVREEGVLSAQLDGIGYDIETGDTNDLQDKINAVNDSLARTMYTAAVSAFKTKKFAIGKQIKSENKLLKSKREQLRRVSHAINTLHAMKGEALSTRCWRKLRCNEVQNRPSRMYGVSFTEFEVTQTATELHDIQETLLKEVKDIQNEEVKKAIDEYLVELDKKEQAEPREFFRRVNPYKKRNQKQIYEVAVLRNGEVQQVLQGEEKVTDYIRSFWKDIFTEKQVPDVPKKEWFETQRWQQIREKVKSVADKMTVEFTTEELIETLRGFKKKTAPGANNIPIECMIHAPKPLLEKMTKLYNAVLKSAVSPDEWRRGVLYMLFKGGKNADPSQCTSFRPISLLQVQYKVCTKMLFNRIMNTLESAGTLSNAQAGWRHERCTQQKIKAIVAAIQDSITQKKTIHWLLIDFKRAYDSVSHKALLETLREMGFNNTLVNLIGTLNSRNTAEVITAYGNTKPYDISRGVRQGDGLAPCLFLLFIEPLLLWLQDGDGYTIQAEPTPITVSIEAFADDLSALTETSAQMERKWEKITKFCTASGLEISSDGSRDKTVYSSNCARADRASLRLNGVEIPFLEPDQHYKYLGCYLNLTLNWEKQIEESTKKLKTQCGYIRHRAFTALQTVSIINKVFIPSLLYRAAVIRFPKKVTREWDSITTKLVFMKLGMPPISGRNYLFDTFGNGGLELLCAETLCEATYLEAEVRCGLNAPDSEIKQIYQEKWRAGGVTNIGPVRVIENEWYTPGNRLALNRWLPIAVTELLQQSDIKSIEDLQDNGKLKPAEWWRQRGLEHIRYEARRFLTAFDTDTLRHEILDELGLHNVRPKIKGLDRNPITGAVRVFLDGSFHEHNRTGGYAVYVLEDQGYIKAQQGGAVRGVYSSYEAELRAIQTALRVLPLEEQIEPYTDSESSLRKIQSQRVSRAKVPRYAKLLSSVKQMLEERKALGKEVNFSFVHSHASERDLVRAEREDDKAEILRKRQRMRELYGESRFEDILIGNCGADRIAGEFAKDAQELTYEHSHLDPQFIIQIAERDVVEQPRRACYQALLEEILVKHRKEKLRYSDWQGCDQLDVENSSLILKERSRNLAKLVSFAFKCRHDKLRTAEHGYNRAAQAKQSGESSEWAEKLIRSFPDAWCPFGCGEVESLDHLVNCKASEKIRAETERELRQDQMDIAVEWLSEGPEGDVWKPKWTWMGLLPKKLTEIIIAKLSLEGKKAESVAVIKKLQITLLEGLRRMWINRCKKLFAKSEHEKNEEREEQRRSRLMPKAKSRKKSKEQRKLELLRKKKSTNAKIAKITAALARKSKRKRSAVRRNPQPKTRAASDTNTRKTPTRLGLDGKYWTSSTPVTHQHAQNDFIFDLEVLEEEGDTEQENDDGSEEEYVGESDYESDDPAVPPDKEPPRGIGKRLRCLYPSPISRLQPAINPPMPDEEDEILESGTVPSV